jgi:hypothetical protein
MRVMTSLHAAKLYGFDLERLQLVADEIGPTPAEVATPVSADELPASSMSFTIADALEPFVAGI